MTRAILFDLDGTLVDSLPGITEAYRFTFDALELDDTNGSDLKQFVGPSIREVLSDHFGLHGSRLEDGVRLFRSHYTAEGLLRFAKYEGVDDMLRRLKGQGDSLYIATSKLWTMAERVIEHADWKDLFSFVGGSKADGSRYLKRDIIAWTLTQVAQGEVPSAMIGDRAVDISGGRALGLNSIGALWGYGSHAELADAGASIIVEHPRNLQAALGTPT